jgi:hypothetical protein
MGYRRAAPWLLALAIVATPAAAAHATASDDTRPVIRLSPQALRELRSSGDAPPATGGLASSIAVDIARGPLTLMNAPAQVTLTRVGHSSGFRARVPGIRVVDTRGTNAGWQLRATVAGVRGSVELGVHSVVAMARSTDGLSAVAAADADRGGSVRLVRAERGTGAGSFDVSLEVEAELPHARGDQVSVSIAFIVR